MNGGLTHALLHLQFNVYTWYTNDLFSFYALLNMCGSPQQTHAQHKYSACKYAYTFEQEHKN